MRYFRRSEFACNCGCEYDTVDFALAKVVDTIREHFAAPVYITSGCRCPEYNKKIGGSKFSQHQYGRAADIHVEGVEPADVADFCEALGVSGVGRYPGFTHVDERTNGPVRWGTNDA